MSYLLLMTALIGAGVIWIAVNRTYGAVIRNKNAQIELLQREINGYKEKLAGASPDQAAAKMAEFERRIGIPGATERLQHGLPTLTDAQIADWSTKLSTYKLTALYLRASEHTSGEFRESLCKLLRKAGWPDTTVGNVAPASLTTISSRGARGAALALVEMFRSVGVSVEHQEFSQLFPEHSAIWITVGCRSSRQSPLTAAMAADDPRQRSQAA